MKWEMLEGAVPSRAHANACTMLPGLTEAIHAPAFELALKGHVVTAGEDSNTVELALHKLPLIPVWEDLLRQQLPTASGNAHGGVRRSAMPTWSHQRR